MTEVSQLEMDRIPRPFSRRFALAHNDAVTINDEFAFRCIPERHRIKRLSTFVVAPTQLIILRPKIINHAPIHEPNPNPNNTFGSVRIFLSPRQNVFFIGKDYKVTLEQGTTVGGLFRVEAVKPLTNVRLLSNIQDMIAYLAQAHSQTLDSSTPRPIPLRR